MATNFSVEWLSKSFYTTQRDTEEVFLPATTQFKDSSHQPKVQTEAFIHTEMEELAKESRNQYSPTSPNNSCGYTSGSESEVGDDSEEEAALHRRMRTKFTSEQIRKLENTFIKHKYLGATQRKKIAEKLNLSETQVKTWFQNRRMKLKRELQDLRPDFFPAASGLLQPVVFRAAPSFQHHSHGGQLPSYSQSAFYSNPVQRVSFPTQQNPVQRVSFPTQQIHIHPMMLPPSYY